MIFDQVLSC